MKNEGWWWNAAMNSVSIKQTSDRVEWLAPAQTHTHTCAHTQTHTHPGILCSWSI